MKNLREPVRYVLVGAMVVSVDTAVFNLLAFFLFEIEPIASKLMAGVCSTLLAFYLHRHWTFGKREYELSKMRQATMFFVVQVIGITIATTCLWISHYVLGFDGVIADNIAGNIVGLVLATIFRFYFNSRYVYR